MENIGNALVKIESRLENVFGVEFEQVKKENLLFPEPGGWGDTKISEQMKAGILAKIK